MGFRSLQRSRVRKSTCGGFARGAAVRLQGLDTLVAVYSFRALAGFISHRRRSWDSPFGASSSRKVSGAFPPGRTHIPFFLPLIPLPKQRAGPAGRGSWASTLAGVPGSRSGISTPTTGCSLGFCPSRVYRPKSWSGFRPISAHTLGTCTRRHACRRPSVSIDFGLDLSAECGKPHPSGRSTLVGFSHRFNPTHSGELPPWLWIHRASRRTLLPTARRTSGGLAHPAGADGTGLGAEPANLLVCLSLGEFRLFPLTDTV
jgi:hypothetical protein